MKSPLTNPTALTMDCLNSALGTYDCYVCIKPFWPSSKELICVDVCLAKEILFLWRQGIVTTGCCCGNHSDGPQDGGFISVEARYVSFMEHLGYEEIKESHYKPKTKTKENRR